MAKYPNPLLALDLRASSAVITAHGVHPSAGYVAIPSTSMPEDVAATATNAVATISGIVIREGGCRDVERSSLWERLT